MNLSLSLSELGLIWLLKKSTRVSKGLDIVIQWDTVRSALGVVHTVAIAHSIVHVCKWTSQVV